jgi:hypothetical protein
MAERTLLIRFVLDESDIVSPSDFVGFFAFGEELVRRLTEVETQDLLEYLDVPTEWRIETIAELERLLKTLPAPAEVREVEHNTPWHYLLAIPAGTVLYFVNKCLHPQIKRAWESSAGRDRFFQFMRDRVFGGAKQKVERQVTRRPSRKGLKVTKVAELSKSSRQQPLLEIRLERTETLQVSISDEELLADFRKRFP